MRLIIMFLLNKLNNNEQKTPAVRFLELILAITFISSFLAKCVHDESCGGDFPPTSPNGLVLVTQIDLCV